MKSIREIRVGGHSIGIVGLDEALKELAPALRAMTSRAVREALLSHLARENYIPDASREAYGEAFYREYLRFIGEPVEQDGQREPMVTVVGPGCPQCERLHRTVLEVLSEIGIAVRVEQVRDLSAIAETGVLGTPALLMGDRILAVGTVPPKAQIRRRILEMLDDGSSGTKR